MTTLAVLAYENQQSKTWIDSQSMSENIDISQLYAPSKDTTCC